MAAIRFLHNYDLIYCEAGANNHMGAAVRFKVDDDKVDAEGKHHLDYRIVTEPDLMKTQLFGCPATHKKPTKIASILDGRAKEILIHGKIPLLINLVAVEAGTGHIIRVATGFSERLTLHEGKKKHVYLDDAHPRNKTVGIGFNMDKPGAKAEFDDLLGTGNTTLFDEVRAGTKDLSQEQMVTLVDNAKPAYEADARSTFPGFDSLSPEQRDALTDTEFNMGNVGVNQFTSMIASVKAGDFKKAARDLLHGRAGGPSKYVNDVHEGRALNIAAAIRWNIVGAPGPVGIPDASPDPGMSADEASKLA